MLAITRSDHRSYIKIMSIMIDVKTEMEIERDSEKKLVEWSPLLIHAFCYISKIILFEKYSKKFIKLMNL